jgi:UDP-2-acetamido-3-amino-2,3-dideoxy-glucuronate N-acetyltransferase
MENKNYSNPDATNYISSTAAMGQNVKIWHFAYVGDKN